MTTSISNPIIPGFFPDPSICRVGEDYYLVNSSFEYFPAIPIWHSKDLVHWVQIGNAIDRESQGLNLDVNVSGGVQACTIRYHKGTYYIVSTCVGKTWPRLDYHFIIHSKDPRGPWSDVIYIQDAPGIDASLFFDDDGKCYFHANRQIEPNTQGIDAEIWAQELDLSSYQLIGEEHPLWCGTGGKYPEGPHIYKRNGYYYLLIAEGGTGHWHTITSARATSIFGPYTSNPRNPILTHKHLSSQYPIQNVGHGDLVETIDGQWFMVCLGVQPRGNYIPENSTTMDEGGHLSNLGRETFLVPVLWEDDISFVAAPYSGKVELNFNCNLIANRHSLESENQMFKWITPRRSINHFASFLSHNKVKITGGEPLMYDGFVSLVARRLTSWKDCASVVVDVQSLHTQDRAGLCLYYSYQSFISIDLLSQNDELILQVTSHHFNNTSILYSKQINTSLITLAMEMDDLVARMSFTQDKDSDQITCDTSHLNSKMSGGHTGCLVGIYVCGCSTVTFDYTNFGKIS